MCGHVGVMGTLTPKLVYAFHDLLNLDMMRGFDSTGVGFVTDRGKVTSLKHTCWPYELILTKEYQGLIHQRNACLIGHNRAATRGTVTKDNAHPFIHGHIMLAHNGTLDNPHKLPDYDNKSGKTDSEAICQAFAKLGVAEAWKLVVGAATVVFWDSKASALNILSNSQRPFHFCYVNGGTAVVWASERDMLDKVLNRRGIAIDNKEVIIPYKDRLYTMTRGNKGVLSVTKTDLEPFSFSLSRPRVHRGDTEYTGSGSDHVWLDRTSRAGRLTGKSSVSQLPFNLKKEEAITEETFENLYQDCLFCEKPLKGLFKGSTPIDPRSAACPKCTQVAIRECIRIN